MATIMILFTNFKHCSNTEIMTLVLKKLKILIRYLETAYFFSGVKE